MNNTELIRKPIRIRKDQWQWLVAKAEHAGMQPSVYIENIIKDYKAAEEANVSDETNNTL